jgi:hypothetical protein
MANTGFHGLVDRICALAHIESSNMRHEIADLEIRGVRFILMDGSIVEEGSMMFLCDFGEVPNEYRAEVLQRLLEANLVMHGVGTPCFSINYETNHVLLMGRVLIDKVPPKVLIKALFQHAEQAKQWRKTWFLLDNECGSGRQEQPAPRRSLALVASRTSPRKES